MNHWKKFNDNHTINELIKDAFYLSVSNPKFKLHIKKKYSQVVISIGNTEL